MLLGPTLDAQSMRLRESVVARATALITNAVNENPRDIALKYRHEWKIRIPGKGWVLLETVSCFEGIENVSDQMTVQCF